MRPPHPDTLDDVLESAWHALSRGVSDRRHAFHTPTLVTTGTDGNPDARTVVLRACAPGERVLICHTDVRSPKVEQIASNPRVLWHLYDYKSRVQLRVAAIASVLGVDDDPLVREAWGRTSAGSRVCYRGPLPPGEEAPSPVTNTPEVEPEDTEAGLDRFRVVRTIVTRIEWLRLRHDGHRRALFEWDGAGALHATWLAP